MHSILIVDDEKDNLDAIFRLLRSAYQVDLCSSPFEALKNLQQKKYALVISDQRMPEMSGVELLEKVNAISPETTRILLTGYTDLESVIQSINRGHIYHYIAKPWDPEEFKLTVAKAVEHFQLKRNLEAAMDDLKLLDKAKARFLSLVSHELNTPLTVLQSFIELFSQSKKQLPLDLQIPLQHLEKASGRFSEIVQEVIQFVNAESSRVKKKENIPASEILTTILSSMKKEFADKKIRVKNSIATNVTMGGDRDLIGLGLRKLCEQVVTLARSNSTLELNKEGNSLQFRFLSDSFEDSKITALQAMKKLENHSQDLGLKLATARMLFEKLQIPFSVEHNAESRTVIFDLTIS